MMMKRKLLVLILMFSVYFINAQIIVDNSPPNDSPAWLVDNVLLGGGVVASNISYQGDSMQIAWFDAVNTNLGIDNGIVLSTGNAKALMPDSFFFGNPPNLVTDPDLLTVANSVPPLLPPPFTNAFTVASINDVAILEFDFIPTSDSLTFSYVFGSQEYFAFENSQYNDVFGFFLSGPGITGPYSSPLGFPGGSVNLAVVPNSTPPLPITISSINSVTPINQQYFVPNQGTALDTIADADGMTTVLTARALVQCGQTYHIRLAIADGSDQGLSSYVWLEAGSFYSPSLNITDNLGIDSSYMNLACNPSITLTANAGDGITYQWFDTTGTVISTDSVVTVPVGTYWVSSSASTCAAMSDTLTVVSLSDSLGPATLECVWLDGDDMNFTWHHPVGASNTTVYNIMGAASISGPYSVVASTQFPDSTFSLPLVSIPPNTEFYYVRIPSTCDSLPVTSDTIAPINVDILHSNVNCWDDTDGRISIDVHSTMLTQYSFYLDSVLNTNPIPYDTVWDNLPAGTYDVTVSDNASCTFTKQVNITAPGYTLQALASDTMNSCYGASLGMAIGYGAGGTPPYAYEWFDASLYNFSSNDTAANLSAGGYLLEVTDANGCDTFTTVTVIEPQTPLSGSPQIFGVACKGDSTGMIVGNAQGSWAPYEYFWYNAAGDLLQRTSNTIFRDTLQGLSAGTYTLELYDVKGCFVSYTLTVGEPATALKVDSVSVIATNACYGDADGEAIFYASGGMPSYVYEWDNGSVTTLASGLTTGYHTFSVSDTWGCEVVDSVFIFGNSEIQSSINILDNVSCYGNSDGSVGISSVGGIPNYAYHWSFNNATTYATPSGSGMTNLPLGVYYVNTEDNLGCIVVDSFFISEPMPLSVEASEFSWVSCFGADDGSGIAIAQGGTVPYIFDWGGGLFGDTVYALTPGYHTVTVTDAEGCTATDTILTHEPPLLSMFIDNSLTVLPYCNGVATGSLTGVSSGGTGSHSYAWSEAVTGPIFGEFTPTLNNVLQGVYTITVTDDRGCMASATGDIDTITSTMSTFITPLVTYSGGWGVSCFGASDGELEVIAFGGVAPYTYDWLTNSSTTAMASNLPEGHQSVSVYDANGCYRPAGFDITEPTELAFTTLSSFDGSCLGSCDGVIELSVSGGTSSYDLIGTDNLTGSVITSPIVGGFSSGICSGDYTISVSDANGCSSVLLSGGNDQIVINVPVATSAAIDASSVVDVACNGGSDGAASALNPSSGSLYSYNWKDLSGSVVGTGTSVSGLAAGTYVLYSYYSSYTGCTSSDTVVISEESAITSSSSVVDVDCFGNATGSIAVTAQGGVGPYVYNPAISNGLSAGNHTITVTDANGCIHTHVSSVGSPLALGVIVNRTGFVLTANTPTGGVSPFSYKWFKVGLGQVGTGSVYTVSNPGNYYVVVTDANFCTVTSADETYIDAGVFDLSSSLFLSVYPNPFKDETMVDFGGLVEEGNLRIVDVYGKLIEEHKVLNAKSFIVSRTNKASGIYFMNLEVDGSILPVFKLIIE